jgi:DNA polymerase-4
VTRWILHVDLDEFIAAVEVLRRPELAGRPVVVGGRGDPTQRGVVSTASYEARAFGIRSGMALRSAYRRCPEAVFVPVDMLAYIPYSRKVIDTLRTFPAVVRAVSLDEASMAIDTEDPEATAHDIQRAVLEATQLWCSIGVGDNPLRAKIASGFAKPRGVFTLTEANWDEVMGGLTPDALVGVGRRRMAKLRAHGIRTVSELARADERELARLFGPRSGPWLLRLAEGEDVTEVIDEPYLAKARGREHTFQEDLTDVGEIRSQVARLAAEVAADLREEGRPAVRVVVKVRFAPFDTHTHGARLDEPSIEAADIGRAAERALERFELDRPVRLLGVRAEMMPPDRSA